MNTEIATSSKVDAILAQRDAALDSFTRGMDLLKQAHQYSRNAAPTANGSVIDRNILDDIDRRPERAVDNVRVKLDQMVWTHLVNISEIDTLMDHKERAAFRKEISESPPAATKDNVMATMSRLLGNADEIFRRGIAESFAGLDRRFKTHDGFKVGKKIILNNAFAGSGFWNQQDILRDVQRAFYVLDDKPAPKFDEGVVPLIDKARQAIRGFGPSNFSVEDEYFHVTVCKNGNIHLKLLRPDLVRKVNRIIGEHLGALVPDATPDRADRWSETRPPKHAKDLGFFKTPPAVIDRMLSHVCIWTDDLVMEPSFGEGDILFRLLDMGARVTGYEINADRVEGVIRVADDKGHGRKLWPILADFLQEQPSEAFDAVIMNPPFADQADIHHVRHAFEFLKPGGKLVAIMSIGTRFRTDNRSEAFRAWVASHDGHFTDLPAGSFKESGTMVNACMLTMSKGR